MSESAADPLTVRCPYCGVLKGQHCQDFRGGNAKRTHLKRIKSAESLAVIEPALADARARRLRADNPEGE